MMMERGMVRRLEVAFDVFLTAMVFVVIYGVKRSLLPYPLGGLTTTPNYYILLLLIALTWYIVLDFMNTRHRYGAKPSGPMVQEVFRWVSVCTVALVLFMYIFKITDVSRLFILLFYLTDMVVLVGARWMVYRIFISRHRDDYGRRFILILGSLKTAQDLIRLVASEQNSEIKVVGCIEVLPEMVGKEVCCGVKVIGTVDDLRTILLNEVIDEILITMPLNEIPNSEWYLSFVNTFGITVRIIPYWYVRKFMAIHTFHTFKLEHFLSEPALVISRVQHNQDALAIKSVLDYVLALLTLIAVSPLFIIIAVAIKSASQGPVFFQQIRSGKDGRKFPLFKFRTMVVGAEEQQYTLIEHNEADGPVFKIKKDPRIIPYIGTFLRKFGLDEIPQFINVLRGEMSIVGPRPPTPAEVE